ncbi:MAG: hypothetical protein LAQ30_14935 [Acidobacteriia bacterium]|nr:hypothetical protein [Terriglobia bacterium]
MKPVECEFEPEVLCAVVQRRWPERVDPRLRVHAAECAICADVAAVAGAIDEASDEMRPSIAVPPAGRVWWLARMRARREAAEAAGRPITAAQGIALAVAVGLLGACFGATCAWFQSALKSFAALLPAAAALAAQHAALTAAMAAVLFLAPTAVYLAIRRL